MVRPVMRAIGYVGYKTKAVNNRGKTWGREQRAGLHAADKGPCNAFNKKGTSKWPACMPAAAQRRQRTAGMAQV